jgi:Flp pilus assembly protein TadD
MTAARSAAEARFFEGVARMQAGDGGGAEASFRAALRLDGGLAEAHANLGWLLERQGRIKEAEASYRAALALDAMQAQTHGNLASLLAGQKRFADAEDAYHQAIRLAPESPATWSNLGVLYASMRREVDAERCYGMALSLDGTHAGARFNLSYILLRQGRFEEGWACLEARDWYAGLASRLPCPRWRGEALAGKSLIIGVEAGLGDMIQFCRYASLLKARGAARITLICHPPLRNLFQTLAAADQVIGLDEGLPEGQYDYWTPPLSLPFYCATRVHTIPADIPYLFPCPEAVARRAVELPAGGVRVGLVWKGNPAFENDADRSLPGLATLAPLWRVAGISFVSLQKGAGEGEAAASPPGRPIHCLPLGDFADTAAVVANLDLVIAVDTAVAHLAGALGKPCWLLLPWYKTDWRWLEGRDDTPWYPVVMRLFRQPAMGEWGRVMEEVAQALARFAGQSFSSAAP